MEQSIQTDTQSDRIEREEHAAELRAQAVKKEKAAAAAARKKAARADDWMTNKIASLSDGGASGVLYSNAALVVALGGVLGYQGWGLHQRGLLSWKHAGIGAAAVGAVAVFESVFYRYVLLLPPRRGQGFICHVLMEFSLSTNTITTATSRRPAATRPRFPFYVQRSSMKSVGLRKSRPRFLDGRTRRNE